MSGSGTVAEPGTLALLAFGLLLLSVPGVRVLVASCLDDRRGSPDV